MKGGTATGQKNIMLITIFYPCCNSHNFPHGDHFNRLRWFKSIQILKPSTVIINVAVVVVIFMIFHCTSDSHFYKYPFIHWLCTFTNADQLSSWLLFSLPLQPLFPYFMAYNVSSVVWCIRHFASSAFHVFSLCVCVKFIFQGILKFHVKLFACSL